MSSRNAVDYDLLRCDNLIITIAFNNDEVIKQQITLINRYCAMLSENLYSGNSPSKSHGMVLTCCWL